ncbi:MAG: dihydropteroate synthase [Gammaproteobacteria bacterium]
MRFGSRTLDLSIVQVMGILNITPDSFSDGGELFSAGQLRLEKVIDRASLMVRAGATLLDVGGESTRPGAEPVSSQQEMERVLPVLQALSIRFDVVLSVDTSSAVLIKAAAGAGAGLINDVRALTEPGALAAAAQVQLPVCLMHMKGAPATMQKQPAYGDVVAEVAGFLRSRIAACQNSGVNELLIDPGFGFGKTLQHNLALLARLQELQTLNLPILVGMSRKRMLGELSGKAEQEREAAGIAAAVLAMQNGACIIRTHDVAGMVDAAKVWHAVNDLAPGQLAKG